MIGAMVTDQYPDLLNSQFKEVIKQSWAGGVNGLEFFRVINSDKNYEKFSAVSGLGLIPISNDEEVLPVDQPIQGYDHTITPKCYRRGIRITKAMREDNLFSEVLNLQSNLADASKMSIEYWAARPYNAGFTSASDFLTPDGRYIFDASHQFIDNSAGTWSNLESGALTAATLATARVNAMKVKDDRGLIRGIDLSTLLVPPDLAQKAFELNSAEKRPEDAMNAPNWHRGVLTPRVWNKLTSTTAWFVLAKVNPQFGLTWVWRVKPTASSYTEGSNDDLFVQKIRYRFGQGSGQPFGMRGSTGA
jgi:hypothetical protein